MPKTIGYEHNPRDYPGWSSPSNTLHVTEEVANVLTRARLIERPGLPMLAAAEALA